MVDIQLMAFRMCREDQGGRIQLGTADFQYGDIRLNGCALVTTSKGGLTVQSPRPSVSGRGGRNVEFLTAELRVKLLRMALASYIAMGGAEFNQDGERIITLENSHE